MIIAIPTYMREENQKLYDSLPQFLKEVTYLFTHSGRYNILVQKYPNANIFDLGYTNGIADVRQKIFNNIPYDKILMLDDNVSFKKKISIGDKITYSCTKCKKQMLMEVLLHLHLLTLMVIC